VRGLHHAERDKEHGFFGLGLRTKVDGFLGLGLRTGSCGLVIWPTK
jgi:hypothetical protein